MCSKGFSISFLIYPYWNVNQYINVMQNTYVIVSNLSILECKSYEDVYEVIRGLVSNLSILECKLPLETVANFSIPSF